MARHMKRHMKRHNKRHMKRHMKRLEKRHMKRRVVTWNRQASYKSLKCIGVSSPKYFCIGRWARRFSRRRVVFSPTFRCRNLPATS